MFLLTETNNTQGDLTEKWGCGSVGIASTCRLKWGHGVWVPASDFVFKINWIAFGILWAWYHISRIIENDNSQGALADKSAEQKHKFQPLTLSLPSPQTIFPSHTPQLWLISQSQHPRNCIMLPPRNTALLQPGNPESSIPCMQVGSSSLEETVV